MGKKTTKRSQYIAIEDLAGQLGLLEEDIKKWLKRDGTNTHPDHRGRPSVPIDLLQKYTNDPRYLTACCKAILIEKASKNFDCKKNLNQKFKEKRLCLLDEYDSYISDLEIIHRNCLCEVNKTGNESSATAIYLLFSRVISILKMCCLCQRNNYWYWGGLIREIDECFAVAEYFAISKNTCEGMVALRKWFRQNEAPQHADCRELISRQMSADDPKISKDDNCSLLYEIYQKKSKFTHPTHLVIREVTNFEILNSIPHITEVEYGQSKHERKLLELTEFFRSSIWTAFQIFMICFSELPLAKNDLNRLLFIHSIILEKEEKEFQKRNKDHTPS